MGQLSGSITVAERYQLAREAGFNPADAIVMAAISMAECGNCDLSGINATGDTGLWQINRVHWGSSQPSSSVFGNLADPLTNAKAAYAVWKGRGGGVSGFQAWCTYPGGCGGQPGVSNWNALLTSSTVAAGQVDPSAPAQVVTPGSDTTTQPTGNVTGSVTAGTTVLEAPSLFGNQALGTMVAHLSSPGFWWAVLLFALGIAAVVAGIWLYAQSGINVQSLAKA